MKMSTKICRFRRSSAALMLRGVESQALCSRTWNGTGNVSHLVFEYEISSKIYMHFAGVSKRLKAYEIYREIFLRLPNATILLAALEHPEILGCAQKLLAWQKINFLWSTLRAKSVGFSSRLFSNP
jgi:hypothetical protein